MNTARKPRTGEWGALGQMLLVTGLAFGAAGCEYLDLLPPLIEDPNNPQNGSCAVTEDKALPPDVPLESLQRAPDLEQSWAEALNQFWGLNICMFTCDTGVAQLIHNNAVSALDTHSVYFDPAWFDKNKQQYGGSDLPNLSIVAHEWGHQVDWAQGVTPPGSAVYVMEQFADKSAGYFLGAQLVGSGISKTQMTQVIDMLKQFACASGSDDWWDPQWHGDCNMRATATQQGWDEAVQQSQAGYGTPADPSAPAPMAGTWRGRLVIDGRVVQDDEILDTTQVVIEDYFFTIDGQGRMVDDYGAGPVPDVGGQKEYPIQGQDINLTATMGVTKISFDDGAARYDWTVPQVTGSVQGLATDGNGFATDLYLLSNSKLTYYGYVSLALASPGGGSATVVLEASAEMTP